MGVAYFKNDAWNLSLTSAFQFVMDFPNSWGFTLTYITFFWCFCYSFDEIYCYIAVKTNVAHEYNLAEWNYRLLKGSCWPVNILLSPVTSDKPSLPACVCIPLFYFGNYYIVIYVYTYFVYYLCNIVIFVCEKEKEIYILVQFLSIFFFYEK